MKLSKILRIIIAASILSLLTILIPAAPALADPAISLSVTKGKIGDSVTITGTGFNASTETSEKHVDVYFAKDPPTGTLPADDIGIHILTYVLLQSPLVGYENEPKAGQFQTTFPVPADLRDGSRKEVVSSGTYYVYVTLFNFTRIKAQMAFTVIGGKVSLSVASGPVGTQVQVNGSDFGLSETVTLRYAGVNISNVSAVSGAFNATLTVPESTAGAHPISGYGNTTQSEASATFTVIPKITANPNNGSPDTSVTVTGTGFGASRNDLIIFLNKVKVATVTTSAAGSFSATFKVPVMDQGAYALEALDGANNTTKLDFAVGPNIKANINATTGNVGTELTITGTGYTANKNITVAYDGTQVATTTAKSDGSVSASFRVPASKAGAHKVTVSDGTTVKEFAFTMDATPPPIPQPALPVMGAKVKNPVSFDWQDVTAKSLPLTYTLQITTTKDFAAGSVVLEKKGLAKSEYTLTEVEKLQPLKDDGAYYWRVKAIDAASNESDWTGAGIFYIASGLFGLGGGGSSSGGGFSISFPGWGIYVLIALGAILLFFIGFWLGRRTSYY